MIFTKYNCIIGTWTYAEGVGRGGGGFQEFIVLFFPPTPHFLTFPPFLYIVNYLTVMF